MSPKPFPFDKNLNDNQKVFEVLSYLNSLTGEEPVEEVLSVTALGLSLGIPEAGLIPPEDLEEEIPWENSRRTLIRTYQYLLTAEDQPRLLRTAEVAELFGMKPPAISNRIQRGTMISPAFVTAKNVPLFFPNEVATYMQANGQPWSPSH